ncbi:DUF4132 domain-containing protein [Streptacidiphilus rugosus]|uniref:DUF4132 domain-containing protein n=1 Tax=Streptacidiphilus rugosus TaxID=405783 RepID=UPI000691BB47|nr:DUF4132 domain-containing protein [Streptacidiphilus rugosus]
MIDDALDQAADAARSRVPWLVDFLESRRRSPRRPGVTGPFQEEYRQWLAGRASAWAEAGGRLAVSPEPEQRAAVLCLLLVHGLDPLDIGWAGREVDALAPELRGWSADEVAVMLRRACGRQGAKGWQGGLSADALHHALDAAEQLDVEGCRAVEPWLRRAHVELLGPESDVEARVRGRLAARLRGLLARVDPGAVPEGLVPAHAPWAAALREQAGAVSGAALVALLTHAASLTGPRPTQRWRRACPGLVDAASARGPVAAVLAALAEGEPVCSREHGSHTEWMGDGYHYHYLVHQNDRDLARGLVWAAALTADADTVPRLAALALRAGGRRQGVAEDLKLAGAAVNALAEVEDPAALEALWRLQTTIKDRALRKQLDTALVTASGRLGITPAQLVERSVPDHGLAPDGSHERLLAGHRVRLAIEDAATVRLSFTAPDGRVSRTAPAAVRQECPDELAQLTRLAKEVRATLTAARARIEALLSTDRSWPYEEWCRHFRDHPVVGVPTRALIWEFQDEDGPWRAVAPGREPDGVPRRVRLWHPIRVPAAEVLARREEILARELRQPFKQAFREVYLLTPAEEETGAWSNRFAAHIVHYQRLYALFKERGWQSNYLGPHSDGYDGLARAEFGDGRWRAGLHHEPVGEEGGHSFDHATTDQVRFERRDGRSWRPVQLAEVPAEVFSEAMRDIDLFVAVTSVAADPDWADRGEDRWTDYRRATAFADLSANAQMRREALERILPRLRIADRCTLDARHLVVRGELADYRIHLGSANILMEPGGRYLCIVPARRAGEGRVFLPFEDERLSLILSKAALLAADTKITDASILAQIRAGA